MTLHPLVLAASENLRETYLSLGRAVPGVRLLREEPFTACLGPFAHPIANFATGLSIDPWSVRRLRDLASKRPVFSVYHTPGDAPDHAAELLERDGFRLTYRLLQMVCENPDPAPPIAMRLATHPDIRSQVARFMTEQFFARQPETFRRRISAATATASELELCDVEERGRRVGAMMLCHTEGLVGVYNLCVVSTRRNRGIGGGMLNWALTLARETNRAVTLQCDPVLTDWYTCRGFVPTGYVDVYALSKREEDDIIL